MIQKLLIANRGDTALRIHRAAKEMGIGSVVIHSTADRHSMPVLLADASVCVGGPSAKDSYLNMASILSAASISGADAIHPGIGFLAENADFAEMVEDHGFIFIGPEPKHIRMMGDKITAKKTVQALGVPVVPGSDGPLLGIEHARKVADAIGYPVLIKASAGGGGKGIKIAEKPEDLFEAYQLASNEALTAFGNDQLYMEKYLKNPRHIEVQVLGDMHGNALHFGERDCSVQRSHQKLVEEAFSPIITKKERAKIGEICTHLVREMGYRGLGTIEFLYEDGAFYFIEMNTRLQVEHTITEMITGIDLVREQIRVASGRPLNLKQEDISFRGHAIECRINAEHPESFMPSPGKIKSYHAPGGLGVRVDSAIFDGYQIPPHYDSLIAKLIVHGEDRPECLRRLKRALNEFVVEGIYTNLPLHRRIIQDEAFERGDYSIKWLEAWMSQESRK